MKIVFYLCLFLVLCKGGKINPRATITIDKIVESMSLEQKIGQTTQVDFIYLNDEQGKTQYDKIQEWNLGSLLVGGNGCPDEEGNISSQGTCMNADNVIWKKVADKARAEGISVNVKIDDVETQKVTILPLLGTDAIRGNQHSVGEILFPHNIGLAASNNVQNFKNSAKWMRDSVIGSGFNFVFSPTVAVSHNPQWGRFYETLGVDTDKVKLYSKAFVEEAQNIQDDKITGVLTSVKHFLGDGATINGYEEGNSIVDEQFMHVFIQDNIKGYEGAVEAKTGNVMVSYDAINGVAMSVHPFVNSKLKAKVADGGLEFEGFVISDYNSVIKTAQDDLPRDSEKMPLNKAYADSFNVGVDMQMISGKVEEYQAMIKQLVEETEEQNPKIDVARLNDAVKRILTIKDKMNLIEYSETNISKDDKQEKKKIEIVKNKQLEFDDALRAALQSLVLLKNEPVTLPIDKNQIQHVILLGDRYVPIGNGQYQLFSDFNNIGAQNGGWTIRWQGYNGNDYWTGELKDKSKATSILDAIKSRFGDAKIHHPTYTNPTNLNAILNDRNTFRDQLNTIKDQFTQANTLVINVLAENPYAEYMGDVNCEYCQTKDKKGCLYNNHDNVYQTQQQATRLEIKTGAYEKSLINEILKGKGKVVTVLISGRPLIIDDPLSISDSFIAAWLPGTTGGEAIVRSIFGEYGFGGTGIDKKFNKLPSPWISTLDSIKDYPNYDSDTVPKINNPKFPTGYGLETDEIIYPVQE